MFGHAARAAARPAVAAAAAAAAANAAQGSAHARAPPAQGSARPFAHPQVHSKIVDRDTDGWVLAEYQDEMVLFQPFDGREVDEAADTVLSMWSRPYSHESTVVPLVSEPGSYDSYYDEAGTAGGSGSTTETEGGMADAIIEAAAAAGKSDVAAGRRERREREQMETLMAITTRMLRRPGMQREVVMCMMEDPEVRELMLRQCGDLDRYLEAAGIHPNPHLLPSSPSLLVEEVGSDRDGATASTSSHPGDGSRPGPGGPNLVSRLVGAVAGALEKAGDALAALGGWLRRYVAAAFVPQAQEEGEAALQEEEELEAEAAEGGRMGGSLPPQRTANQVLGGVMVLAVAVFCVAIIRRPLVLRALSRR